MFRVNSLQPTVARAVEIFLGPLRFKSFIMVLSVSQSKFKEKTNKTLVPNTAWAHAL